VSLTFLKWSMSIINSKACSPERATTSISRLSDIAKVASIGQTGERVFEGQVAQVVDDALHVSNRQSLILVARA
jgi:hypothetical protein